MKRLIVAGLLGLALVTGCANTTAGTAAPSKAPAATQSSVFTTRPAPTTTTPRYTLAEQQFLVAYVTTDPANALQGGWGICTSVQAGMFREDIVEMIANNQNQVGYDSANKVFDASVRYLCPGVQVKTKPVGPQTTIESDGVFEVGADMAPGKFKTSGGPRCYWARLKANGEDIIDNDLPGGPTTVTVKAGELFKTQSCGTWTKS